MFFDQKKFIFYKSEEERIWLLDNIDHSTNNNSSQRLIKIKKWRQDLDSYLIDPKQKPAQTMLGFNNSNDRVMKCKLNLDTFDSFQWEDIEGWKKKILYMINAYLLSKNLVREKIISIQFIGSIGSKDPIPYSDFDCVIILPELKTWNFSQLRELKNIYQTLNYFGYLFDPFQHHDVFILTELELTNGIGAFYPENLFKMKWGYGRKYFHYSKNLNNYQKSFRNFINSLLYLRRMEYYDSLPNSLHSLKYLLSVIFLLPVYYYNSQNNFFGKKDAIFNIMQMGSQIKKDFQWVSKFRDSWPLIPFPLIKYIILKSGKGLVPLSSLALTNRRIEFHFRKKKTQHYFLHYSRDIVYRGNRIADNLLKKIILEG